MIKILKIEKRRRKNAVLIDGARRVGKSYIVEKLAINCYKSYILIDFNKVSNEVNGLFENYLDDLDALTFCINQV